jgi:hypothetical protein
MSLELRALAGGCEAAGELALARGAVAGGEDQLDELAAAL